MKQKRLLKPAALLTLQVLLSASLFAQSPLPKQWDARFGGSYLEGLSSLQQTADGGYILGGYSSSGISGDKTQGNWGPSYVPGTYPPDYWIVKTDAGGVKQWDARFGGDGDDRITSLQQTADGGYILGGWSKSGISGDKTQGNWGASSYTPNTPDYWIVKIDAGGVKQWDARFGGSDIDELHSVQQTADGGYILGGYSVSSFSGNIATESKGGRDYWIVKTNAGGVRLWDARFGGSYDDYFSSLQQTADGGYILGGTSPSEISGDKTQASRGGYDYWIVKINSGGVKQWDAGFGGSDLEEFRSLQQTADGGYILGGWSQSGISGDKTQATWGVGHIDSDYWIVKTDAGGVKQWDARFGGSDYDGLESLQQTADGGYILGGTSPSEISGDKTQASQGYGDFWIVKLGNSTLPIVKIRDQSILEGNSGQQTMKFKVICNGNDFQTVTVDYTTLNGTAKSTSDYVATSGTLSFAAGVKNQYIYVTVNGDLQVEPDETFKVKLSNPTNATIKHGTAVGTILNDDNSAIASGGNTISAISGNNNIRSLTVFPVPAINVATVQLKGFNGNITLQLTMPDGKVLKEEKLQAVTGNDLQKQLNVTGIPGGMYFLTAIDANGSRQTIKLVIAH